MTEFARDSVLVGGPADGLVLAVESSQNTVYIEGGSVQHNGTILRTCHVYTLTDELSTYATYVFRHQGYAAQVSEG